MTGLVYKVIEVTGTSPEGVKGAVAQALERVKDDGLAIRFFVIKDTEIITTPSGDTYVRVLMDVGINLAVSAAASAPTLGGPTRSRGAWRDRSHS
jgi:flavin-binding protein dodecin